MSYAETGNRIALDAMGADLGPAEMVAAAALSLQEYPNIEPIVLVGQQEILNPLVEKAGLARNPKISVVHASEVIEMTDKPLQALKRKKDSSMIRAIEMLKEKQVRAVVSCGNTGALMAGGTLKLRMLDGVERPALGTVIPHKTGRFVLVDAGANPEGRVEYLVHNAILGSNYCKVSLGVERPRVGLLTIGTEEGKGNELINDTHEQLKRLGDLINYQGPIEGFHVFDDVVDVVVCDGFVGNVVLKTCESLFHMLQGFLKEELLKDPIRKGGAFLAQGAFKAMKSQLNPDLYAGAPLLGLRGNIFKSHGSSNRHAVKNALRTAHEVIVKDLNVHIVEDIARANEVIAQSA
jgi:glycerol-3-phosphate acyltransferase PlsX